MNSACILEREESRDLVCKAIQNRIQGILSFTSRNKWHVARIVMANMTEDWLHVEVLPGQSGPQPVNVQVGQPVGISFKVARGKFLFDATVEAFEPSADPSKGGLLVVAYPDQIEAIQRRSYYRVRVPASLPVNVAVWHRLGNARPEGTGHRCVQGRLVDLSAGGTQIAIPCGSQAPDSDNQPRPDFKKGQYVGVRFTPLPYEEPLTFNAQIRNILPTADGSALCMGLQLVGLEASREGRETLSRIAGIVDQYYRMNDTLGPDLAPCMEGDPDTLSSPQPPRPTEV